LSPQVETANDPSGACTSSRLLSTLTDSGLVQHLTSTGRYRLGVRILQLASAARKNLDLHAVARPLLEELAELSGETVTLSLPGEHDVLTVDFVQSSRSVRSLAEIGAQQHRSRHRDRKGLPRLRRPSARRRPGCVHRRQHHRSMGAPASIDEIAEQGYGLAVRERDNDLSAVAVPVLDGDRRLIAILGVQGPATRFDAATMAALVPALRDRALLIAAAF